MDDFSSYFQISRDVRIEKILAFLGCVATSMRCFGWSHGAFGVVSLEAKGATLGQYFIRKLTEGNLSKWLWEN